jgi:hypothetical protein
VKPLYDLRISDLSDQDAVQVTCLCGHEGEISGAVLKASSVPPITWITGRLGIAAHLKCQGCGRKGGVVLVTVRRVTDAEKSCESLKTDA